MMILEQAQEQGTGQATGTLDVADTIPVFTSQATWVVNENVTFIGTVRATLAAPAGTDLTMTYTIGETTGPVTLGNRASSFFK